MTFEIIAAIDDRKGLGKNGDLAWRLSADLKHFKEITTSLDQAGRLNAVMMGRKTWESLPERMRPLPGRINVVLTKNSELNLPPGVLKCHDLNTALNILKDKQDVAKVFVIGGAHLYGQAINHPACHRLLLTHVRGDFDCDVFFPSIPSCFKLINQPNYLKESAISFAFLEYSK